MSDQDMAATPYAQLWIEELGAVVPQYRPGEAVQRPRRRPRDLYGPRQTRPVGDAPRA